LQALEVVGYRAIIVILGLAGGLWLLAVGPTFLQSITGGITPEYASEY
jgi:hypothetical protein